MPNLLELGLELNGLSGEAPESLFNMSSLQFLGLAYNQIGGTLPPNTGTSIPNIICLYLDNNKFHVHIPASLGNASRLELLSLPFNNFAGQIPSSLGTLPNLYFLYLWGKRIEASDLESWKFLYGLANCISSSCNSKSTNLRFLYLGENRLSGIVPPVIQNLGGLFDLGLEGNHLTGTIEWIGNLRNLVCLHLQENNFVGKIPSSIGNLTNLEELVLAENAFSGHIPGKLGNLQQLQMLNHSHNNLEGGIPSNLGNLGQLNHLDLSCNNL